MGESTIETYSTTGNILSQVFEQPYYTLTSVIDFPNDEPEISLYPNPNKGFINIKIQDDAIKNKKKFKVIAMDMTGKILFSKDFSRKSFIIELRKFSMVNVFLQFNKKKYIAKNFYSSNSRLISHLFAILGRIIYFYQGIYNFI